MFDVFTADARRAVVRAQETARTVGSPKIDDRHLAMACLHEPVGMVAAVAAGADLAEARSLLDRPASGSSPAGHIPFTRSTKKALERTHDEMVELGHRSITSAHILLGALTLKRTAKLLEPASLSAHELRDTIAQLPGIDHERDMNEILDLLLGWPSTQPAQREELLAQKAIHNLVEGSIEEARKTIDQIESLPLRAMPTVMLGEITGYPQMVIEHAPLALERTEDSTGRILSARALAHAHRGDADAARADIQRAIESDPASPVIRLVAAEAEILLDDQAAAGAHVDTTRHLSPSAPPSLVAWQVMLTVRLEESLASDQVDEQLAALRQALGGSTAESAQRLDIDIVRATLARRRGDHQEAIELAAAAHRAATDEGYGAVALDALVEVMEVQRASDDEIWRSSRDDAVSLAEELGHRVIARRLRGLE